MTKQEHIGSVAMGDSSEAMIEAAAQALADRNHSLHPEAFRGIAACVLEAALSARPVQEPVDGITISQTEVKALLYGVPKFEFSQALTRLAAWLAERDDTAPQPAHGTSATDPAPTVISRGNDE